MKRTFLIVITALFLSIQIAAAAPLQKVQLKIEGLHEESLSEEPNFFICLFTPATNCEDKDIPLTLQRIKTALLSVPGVKTVDFRIKKKWFLFKDYSQIQTFVEFELGTLTSETLVMTAESVSDQKSIFKVKFVE